MCTNNTSCIYANSQGKRKRGCGKNERNRKRTNPLDIMSKEGLAWLGVRNAFTDFSISKGHMDNFLLIYTWDAVNKHDNKPDPRLALTLVLSCVWGEFVLIAGVLCSSWVAINKSVSKRSYLNPMGDLSQRTVRYGNGMVSRFLLQTYNMIFNHQPGVESWTKWNIIIFGNDFGSICLTWFLQVHKTPMQN